MKLKFCASLIFICLLIYVFLYLFILFFFLFFYGGGCMGACMCRGAGGIGWESSKMLFNEKLGDSFLE